MIPYLLALGLSGLARLLPPRLAAPLCWVAGTVWWAVAPGARRAVRANLGHVCGPDHPRLGALVRQVFRHAAANYYDTFRIPRLRRADLEHLVVARGWEHLDAALAGGRGAIIVGAHLSSLALAAQVIAARGYPVTGVAEPVQPERLFRLLARHRAGFGLRVLPIGPGLARTLLETLERNEIVGLISDRVVGRSGVCVRFFDAEARLPDGPALLALRSGAPLLPAVATRRPDGRFDGVIEPPIPIERTGDLRADRARITRQIAERLEYHIRRHPEQWTVLQPVWQGC